MTMRTTEFETVAARIERLENQVRHLKASILGLLMVGAIGLLMGSYRTEGERNTSQRFTLRDGHGKERAWFGMGPNGPSLRFLNDNGDEQGALDATSQGMMVRLLNARGTIQSGLSVEPLGVALVSYTDTGRPLVGTNALMNDGGILIRPPRARGTGP
jgi:hypothetical protein